jgi:hypothetical protein
MTEQRKPTQEGLVPVGPTALVTGSAKLVQRGLELIDRPSVTKRKVYVLIGNSQGEVTKCILNCIDPAGECEVHAILTSRAQGVIDCLEGEGNEFDLCVVVLNNLSYPRESSRPDSFAERALAFVAELTRVCRPPVLVMAGWPDDLAFAGKVARAGARHFFWLPFPVPDFVETVEKCLSERRNSRQKR